MICAVAGIQRFVRAGRYNVSIVRTVLVRARRRGVSDGSEGKSTEVGTAAFLAYFVP